MSDYIFSLLWWPIFHIYFWQQGASSELSLNWLLTCQNIGAFYFNSSILCHENCLLQQHVEFDKSQTSWVADSEKVFKCKIPRGEMRQLQPLNNLLILGKHKTAFYKSYWIMQFIFVCDLLDPSQILAITKIAFLYVC